MVEPTYTQYTITFKVQQQKFHGNSGGVNSGEWSLVLTIPISFVWQYCWRYKLFTMTADGSPYCALANEVRPSIDDTDKFLSMYDRAQKRNILISGIDFNRLRSFGGKKWNYLFTSTLICHPKKIFNLVKANLLTPEATDRSGVASISVMNHMKEKLKGYHSRHLATTSDMCWTIWANDILRQPAHVHQSLIERGLQVILFIFSAQ